MFSWWSVILAIAFTAGGAYCGYRVSARYLMRERVLSELIRLCRGLINDISFSHDTVLTLAQKYQNRLANISSYLEGYIGAIQAGEDISAQTLKQRIDRGVLSAEEYDLVISMFCELGKTSAEFQRSSLSGMLEIFKSKYQTALEEAKKYGSLYSKLGLLAGLAIGIAII